MSMQGDTELSDLVAQTLENSGVLAKIRAELRASVFLVLEEHEAFKGRNVSTTNKPLKDFLATQEGIIIVSLIREFLEYFGLEFTASVFEPEIQADKIYEYNGREKLAQDLKLIPGKKSPLIAQVLQDSKICLYATSVPKDSSQENVDLSKDPKNTQENSNFILRTEGASNVPMNGLGKSLESPVKEALNIDGKPMLHPNTSPSFQTHLKKPDRLDLNQINLKSPGSSLSSLGGLPPLGLPQNNQSNKISNNKSTKQVSSDIKALLELGSDSPENNYEEDFHPSGSEKASKGTNRSLSGSGSEVEEEMSVGMEDHTTDLSSGKSSADL